MQSWLIGVGWVLYGGQLFGRWFHDAWLRDWAQSRWGYESLRRESRAADYEKPEGGEKGGQS